MANGDGLPEASYSPGTWVAIAGSRAWLLAEIDPASPVVSDCWSAMRRGAQVDDILGIIVQEGFRAVSSFGLADYSGGGGRLALRGTVIAHVLDETGETEELRAEGVATWVGRELSATLDSIALTAPGAAPGAAPGQVSLPLSGGVTMASRLSVAIAGARGPDVAPPHVQVSAAPLPAAAAAPLPAASAAAAVPPEMSARPDPAQQPPDDPSRIEPTAEDVAGAPSFDHLFGATQRPGAVADMASGPTLEPPPESALPSPPEESAAPSLDKNPAVATLRPDDTLYPRHPAGSGLIDALPWNVPGDSDLPTFVQPAVFELPPRPAQPPAFAQPPAAALPPGFAEPPGFVQLPAFAQPVADAMSPGGRPAPPTSAEATVNRATLLAGVDEQPAHMGPTVLAALCPVGHLSPAYAGVCRICQSALPPQDAFTAPRPVLGALHLSTGDEVTLDRGVILGRAPQMPEGNDPDRPHVVRLASPGNDISRTHVEVRLDGWHVLVTDLDSTNGTVVTLPGQQPQRLRANDPQAIEPGTVVSLADEVTFRYEVRS